MILRIVFGVLVGYLIYKLIVDLIFPVVRTTRQVRRQFRDIHERMQQQANGYQQQASPVEPTRAPQQQPAGDYIEFEEVK